MTKILLNSRFFLIGVMVGAGIFDALALVSGVEFNVPNWGILTSSGVGGVLSLGAAWKLAFLV